MNIIIKYKRGKDRSYNISTKNNVNFENLVMYVCWLYSSREY